MNNWKKMNNKEKDLEKVKGQLMDPHRKDQISIINIQILDIYQIE